MPSTSNFDLTYNQQNVVAGGALSNPAATTGTSAGSGVTKIIQGTNVAISPTSGVGDVTISATAGGTGTVTEVKGQGSVNGITLTGDVTTSGYLTLGGTLGSIANTQLSNSTITIAGNSTALGGTVTQDQITGLSATTAGIVKHTTSANTLALATAGTDYSAGTSALATGIVKSTTSTGALSIAAASDINSTLGTQSANAVYAGPSSGTTPANPAFRSLVSADIPSLNYVASSGGTATNLTLAGTLKDSNSSSAGTSGQVLSSTATGTKWITPSSGGNVTGTGSSVIGNFAAFSNTGASGINDTGYNSGSFVAASSGSAANLTLTGTLTAGGSAGTSGYFLQTTGSGVKWAAASGGSGLTSVGLSMPSEFTVSGSPLTANGTITVTKANEAQNSVYAGPSSGGAGAPTFRALANSDLPTPASQSANTVYAGPTTGSAATPTFRSLVSSDIPALSYVASSGGTATNLTLSGTLTASSSTGTSGYYLQSTGSGVQWAAGSGGLPSGSQGQALLYGSSGGAFLYTAINVLTYGTSFSAISSAISAAQTAGTSVYFPQGSYTISSNLGYNVTCPVIIDGNITISSGVTLTLNGTVTAPHTQVFTVNGALQIGPNTSYIYPEWFGTPKTGTADDAPGIQAALAACSNSAGAYNQWVVLTGSYYISSTISMINGKMFRVVGAASFYKYGTFSGDAAVKFQYAPVGQNQGASVISDIPSLYNFTGISGLTLDGNQAIEVRGHTIKNCQYAVTIKGETAATAGADRACNTNIVKINFITNCYTGFYFLDDGHAATIQGNELYCNFYTNDSLTSGLAAVRINNQDCSNWDGNLVSIKSIDLGNATSSYGFYNTSTTLLPCWVLECALWMGGIGSANWSSSAFVKGPYSSCTFRMRMSGALGSFPWTTIAITGFQNRVEFINGGGNYNYTADPLYGGQPISAYTVTPNANSRNLFNTTPTSVTDSASFNNRYTCKYEIGAYSSIPANGLLTLYAYTPITDAYVQGYSHGYPIVAASNNFNAIPFTNEGLVFESAYDNSTVNANEVVLNFRNVSGSTISGGFFNFIFTCGL